MTEYERINNLKHVLIDYAERYDAINGGFTAIQAVQKMAGFSSEKDYLYALMDGISYGNWPWTRQISKRDISKPSQDNQIHYIGCPAYGGNEFGICTCIKMGKE